jgi:hypothetical protein
VSAHLARSGWVAQLQGPPQLPSRPSPLSPLGLPRQKYGFFFLGLAFTPGPPREGPSGIHELLRRPPMRAAFMVRGGAAAPARPFTGLDCCSRSGVSLHVQGGSRERAIATGPLPEGAQQQYGSFPHELRALLLLRPRSPSPPSPEFRPPRLRGSFPPLSPKLRPGQRRGSFPLSRSPFPVLGPPKFGSRLSGVGDPRLVRIYPLARGRRRPPLLERRRPRRAASSPDRTRAGEGELSCTRWDFVVSPGDPPGPGRGGPPELQRSSSFAAGTRTRSPVDQAPTAPPTPLTLHGLPRREKLRSTGSGTALGCSGPNCPFERSA